MKNIQKYIVLLLIAMLFMPDSAWAQANKQEFVIKGVVEDSFGDRKSTRLNSSHPSSSRMPSSA